MGHHLHPSVPGARSAPTRNFTSNGAPYADVYNPDLSKPLPERDYLRVLSPRQQAGKQDVFEWLDHQADEWVSKRFKDKS